MKVAVAIDSFKGSLTSIDAGKITASAIRDVDKNIDVKIFPLADGGEGTVDALTNGLGGKMKSRYGIVTLIIRDCDLLDLSKKVKWVD